MSYKKDEKKGHNNFANTYWQKQITMRKNTDEESILEVSRIPKRKYSSSYRH